MHQLPKVELHCHADGVIDPAMLRALGAEFEDVAAALEGVSPVQSFAHWAAAYDPVLARFLDPVAARLPLALLAQAERWRGQNVHYAELFVSRVLGAIPDQGALLDWFRALRARLDAVADGPRINLVMCVGQRNRERLAHQAARILPLARAGLVTGVALAGDESAGRVRDLEDVLANLRAHGLGIEIHAGETAGPESVRDALDHGHPHRLGHAVRAFDDPALVERLARDRIHVEFCPTSNLRLGVIPAIHALPVRAALQAGVEFTINTDDPGPFGCTLTSELEAVTEAFALTDDDFKNIFRWGLRAAFDPNPPTSEGRGPRVTLGQ